MITLMLLSMMLQAPTARDLSVREPIEMYFQAHATGNPDLIRKAFTPDATIKFVDNGQTKTWTVEEFASRFKGPAEDEDRRVRRIDSITISGDVASAVLTLDYPQVRFTDHFLLMKSNGSWKVVTKVFHADRKLSKK